MRVNLYLFATALGGCASGTADPGLDGLAVSKVAPGTIIPGTKLVVKGASFVEEEWGAATLRLVGKAGGASVDVAWPATFVDFSTLHVAVDRAKIDALGGDIDFTGDITVAFIATSDGETYKSAALVQNLQFRKQLTPAPTDIVDSGIIFVNDQIEVDGSGFLLGGDEGTTYARVTGCFQLAGGGCAAVAPQEIAMSPREELSRLRGAFPFAPKIAGILPGKFIGDVTLVNKHLGGSVVMAGSIAVTYDLVTAEVFSSDPPAVSLGQYMFIRGGGFVGGEPGAITEIELVGQFTRTGMPGRQVAMNLVPEFANGNLVRYIIDYDELKTVLDLRTETGRFSGTVTPIIRYGAQTVRGKTSPAAFDIAPVKQVVHLDFTPSYVEALRGFGLRAVERRVRDRVLAVLHRTYEGVNIEFRTEAPTDFADYSEVTLTGVDPNDRGLFGYDNTPGKDRNNLRLHDKLGGVNAQTQQDNAPGYGGVFLRSMLAFSKHPGSGIEPWEGADPMFDKIFDPLRADQDGTPITSGDLAGDLPALSKGDSCPATDRRGRVQCAIYVLGNLVGGTLGHEIGHSLGLANPWEQGDPRYSNDFHNLGEASGRLMDAGGLRPFLERAELMGHPHGVFCDDEYDYLKQILPSNVPGPNIQRPPCS